MRDEENRDACPLKRVQATKHSEGNTMADKGSQYYRNFPESQRCNIHDTDSDSHVNAGIQNTDIICYSNSILHVIASCTHLMEFFLSPPSKDRQRFTLYYKFANVIHSMITGGPDVVNPYNFMEIFKSNHKRFDASECTYIL
jgi:ubiquitin C-terminal hydrolase